VRFLENVRLSLRRLRHRPVRSFLLLQGTIWGVAVSLFPTAVMEGTRQAVTTRGSEIGADRITLALDPTTSAPKPLLEEDVEAVRAALLAAGTPAIALGAVAVTRPGLAQPESAILPAALLVGAPEACEARGLTIARGRLPREGANGPPEVVVEGLLGDALDATGVPALGAALALPDGRTGTVVGVLATRTPLQRRTNDLGFDTEHAVFRGVTGKLLANLGVPFGDDAWKRTDRCAYAAGHGAAVDWAFLRVAPTDVRAAAKTADRTLQARGKAAVLFYPPVYPLVMNRELDRFKTVSLALFLACLVMGGVVMANVGLLAALRRAPEVALHRVEGATRSDVATQFLAEGFVLSVAGVVTGWALACGLAQVRIAFEPMAGMTWAFPWPEAFVTLVVSVVIGVLACLLPAMRAAAQDPVEALADE